MLLVLCTSCSIRLEAAACSLMRNIGDLTQGFDNGKAKAQICAYCICRSPPSKQFDLITPGDIVEVDKPWDVCDPSVCCDMKRAEGSH